MKELTIGVDIDGVLFDFVEACRLRFKVENPPEPAWAFWRDWGLNDDDFWNDVHGSGLMVGGPIDELALATLKTWEERGHHIHVITSRNPALGANVGTWQWLHDAGVPMRSFTHTSDKWRVNCDVLIEDFVPTLQKWGEAHKRTGVPILLDRPYNREDRDEGTIVVCEDWGDIASTMRLVDRS